MDQKLFLQWQSVVPSLPDILKKMQEKTIIGFGMVPYPRIVPALFLQNYLLYTVKDTADIDVLRPYAKVFCLEEKFPKAAEKIHAASYLLGNYAFQAFLKSRTKPFRLLMHRTTQPIVDKLEERKIDWIGNMPETFEDVRLRSSFSKVLERFGLPFVENIQCTRDKIFTKSFEEFSQKWHQPIVAYRIFPQTGTEQNPFIILDKEDWEEMIHTLALDEKFSAIQIGPVVRGLSLSVVGCATHLGTLTSALELQLHNVPEVLQGQPLTRLSLGQDFGFCNWDAAIEKTAQGITEKVGELLFSQGYKGVFGIDFVYDPNQQKIFATECMPQFTEDLHVYSFFAMGSTGLPPMEFFHIMANLNIKETFHFEKINNQLKKRMPGAHIFLLREGIKEMKLPLRPGIYSFSPETNGLSYQREGAFPWQIEKESEFLMLDSMPRYREKIIDNVPSLFKIIFPRSIAESSSSVQKDVGALLTNLSTALRS